MKIVRAASGSIRRIERQFKLIRTGARGPVGGGAQTATQAEMEAGTEAALRSVSPLLVAQAIAALAGAGIVLVDYEEGSETLVFTAGAATLAVDTCRNIQRITLTQNSAITTSGTPELDKPITLVITHSGGPWTLSINTVDLGLVGAAGETERVLMTRAGANYLIDRAQAPDVVI